MRTKKEIIHLISMLVIMGLVIFNVNPVSAKHKPKVLIFCKTIGFHHASIALGVVAIQKLGAENKFDVDSTTDATKINSENLKQYAAVIFLSTTGNIFNSEQEQAFEEYIRAGHGFVGVHSATDTEYDWKWYNNLVGAYFNGHPFVQQVATLNVVDRNFIATKHLPEQWSRKDEWYNFKSIAPNLHILIKIDESTYKGGTNGADHPMAWYHDFDGGRAFYTELGHTDESYSEPLYLQHLLGGIKYAIGKGR